METENGRVQENRYDAENLRFELLENGRRTSFVYHNGELLHEEGRVEQKSSYHLGMGIDAFQRGQELSYCHRDEQLSMALITGGQGGIQNSYQYDAFGVQLEEKEQFYNRIRYTGQQYDELTEQYYLRARYYNPVLGRFMQEDVYQGDGLNLYAYCENNPVVYNDPSGYQKKVGLCPVDHTNDPSGTVNPNDVHFMQDSIRNQTGDHTVLDNAEALRNGTLSVNDLPNIRIWEDKNGVLWTLDHRRLAAFRLAGLEEVPFEWANIDDVLRQSWKMTTQNGGTSIILKLVDGLRQIIE